MQRKAITPVIATDAALTDLECLTLPVDQLLARSGLSMESIEPDTLPVSVRKWFVATLLEGKHMAPVILVPAGDHNQAERDGAVRRLIWRHVNDVANGTAPVYAEAAR